MIVIRTSLERAECNYNRFLFMKEGKVVSKKKFINEGRRSADSLEELCIHKATQPCGSVLDINIQRSAVGRGGRFKKERTDVCSRLIYGSVRPKPTHHCKATVLQ